MIFLICCTWWCLDEVVKHLKLGERRHSPSLFGLKRRPASKPWSGLISKLIICRGYTGSVKIWVKSACNFEIFTSFLTVNPFWIWTGIQVNTKFEPSVDSYHTQVLWKFERKTLRTKGHKHSNQPTPIKQQKNSLVEVINSGIPEFYRLPLWPFQHKRLTMFCPE